MGLWRLKVACISGCAMVLAALPAQAAVISGTYSFVGSAFLPLAPTDPLRGSVTVTFNTAQDYSNQTAGISASIPAISLGSQLAFTYLSAADELIVGGLSATVTVSDPNSQDFALLIAAASTRPSVTLLSYSLGRGTVYTSTASSITFAATATTPTPEPASLGLVGAGLMTIGVWRRRKPMRLKEPPHALTAASALHNASLTL